MDLYNYVENLRWVTHEENMNNEITTERIKTNKGGKVEILDTLTGEIYLGYEEAARAGNVSKATIQNHLRGKIKKTPRWVYYNNGQRIVEK